MFNWCVTAVCRKGRDRCHYRVTIHYFVAGIYTSWRIMWCYSLYSLAKYCIQQTQRLLQRKARSVDNMDHVISTHQDELKNELETTTLSQSTATNGNQRQRATEITSESNDDDDDMLPAPPTKGRGRWVCVMVKNITRSLLILRGRGTKRSMESVRSDWL